MGSGEEQPFNNVGGAPAAVGSAEEMGPLNKKKKGDDV